MIPLPDTIKNKLNYGLYIVSTPIGNLSDITIRAINILENSDYILCEDTRTSKKLLERYKIKSKLISNHKFNEIKNLNKIIEILKSEKIVSLVSDAGTPTISDPGRIIINECIKNKINVYPIPGPSAVSTAVSISGFSEKYFFYGFFPNKKKDLNDDLKSLSGIKGSIVFFISPNKINDSIEYLRTFFSGRKILIGREMTKFFEEYIRADINDLKPFLKIPKGELTLVISENINNQITLNDADKKKIKKMIKNLSIKDIVNLITKSKKISKKEVYNYCLSIKK
ncbi:MAG TPA: 16S rRNA (cytidine(1402)-2'-O)-methyltransferase [Candidatus Pelagibacter bacterium]|jgi:16S rRNA (cytidine1402-2'-O)-methyltransferase|nr:16S rRNA (cytidine(1402)-2'-O)-methyltransferase [Candidatus Pelagibacter bacterium]|tara:strand:- start:1541 stop:2389 length:849 start_codon:yes stop_codon:yes gene_type:complete